MSSPFLWSVSLHRGQCLSLAKTCSIGWGQVMGRKKEQMDAPIPERLEHEREFVESEIVTAAG